MTITILLLVLMEAFCQAQSPNAANNRPTIAPGANPDATLLTAPDPLEPSRRGAEAPEPLVFENLLYSVRHVPADELARSLGKAFSDRADMRIATDRENQLLVIRVSAAGKAGVLELLRQLDGQPRTADVVLLLLKADKEIDEPEKLTGPLPQVLETIQHLEAGGQVYVSRRLELTALENQTSLLQFGQAKSVLVGSNAGGFGGRSNSYREQTFGTMLSVKHRATDATHCVAEIELEISELDEPRPAKENDDLVLRGVSTFTYKSTLELQNGQARLIQRSRSHSAGESDAVTYLVIGSTTRAPGEQGDMQVRVLSNVPAPRAVEQVAPTQKTASADTVPANTGQVGGTEAASEQAGVAAKEGDKPSSAADRYAGAVRGYINRYDRDKSGFLEKDEWNTIQGLPAEVDADGDQRISREELFAWLSSRLDDPPSPVDANVQRGSLAEYTLRRYDADASGALERAEWAAMASDPSAADANQDSVISREELIVWLNGRFRPNTRSGEDSASAGASETSRGQSGLSDEQFQRFADAMVRRYDRNGDQKLDATEQALMSRPPAGADSNGDGFVTSEEMAGWLRKQ